MGVQSGSAWLESPDSTSGVGALSVREDETALCLDCRVTFSIRNRACPKCGGEHFWLVAKWIRGPAPSPAPALRFHSPRAPRGLRLRHAT